LWCGRLACKSFRRRDACTTKRDQLIPVRGFKASSARCGEREQGLRPRAAIPHRSCGKATSNRRRLAVQTSPVHATRRKGCWPDSCLNFCPCQATCGVISSLKRADFGGVVLLAGVRCSRRAQPLDRANLAAKAAPPSAPQAGIPPRKCRVQGHPHRSFVVARSDMRLGGFALCANPKRSSHGRILPRGNASRKRRHKDAVAGRILLLRAHFGVFSAPISCAETLARRASEGPVRAFPR
jgi:hypothetical protein